MLVLNHSQYQVILDHARAGAPKEVCGLIAGVERRELRIIKKIYPLTNVDDSAEHFAMDPHEQFAAAKDIRNNNWTLLGNYHSHPASPARPSKEDIRLAFDSSASYLIISLVKAQHEVLRGFRIQKGEVSEEKIILMEDEKGYDASGL
jgi:[CysO sulfur-carrier protein]-S-L-cysteine hydrolase